MTFAPQNLVYVYYYGSGKKELVGRLLLKNRQIFFEYDPSCIKNGIELSPFTLGLKPGVLQAPDPTFDGLFGLFNDSLPDGWGRLLLDRKLMRLGIGPGTISPLDRLCFAGKNCMGALSYEPENPSSVAVLSADLDEIDHEVQTTLADNNTYVEELFALGGSSGGARPKVLLTLEDGDWLVKFRSDYDPKDIGPIEYAYHLMAKEAGLNVPEASLFPSKRGPGFFGVKRFDRKDGQRIHIHTVSGMLQHDYREPSLDYETIMKTTLYLTRDVKQCEVQFRNAVFNVLSHNRDDHSKNFSFLIDKTGGWAVSPAYDLTFSHGPAGEHSTTIMGEGKIITEEHLLRLAGVANIKKARAVEIIYEVLRATQKWSNFAGEAGVLQRNIEDIGQVLTDIAKWIHV